MNILIVDDSSLSRKKLKKLLDRGGIQVTESNNGLDALIKLRKERYNLLITDLLMPEMDGLSLMEKVKENDLRIPMVVVSANAQESVKQQCRKYGIIGFLNKPIKEEELLMILNKAIV